MLEKGNLGESLSRVDSPHAPALQIQAMASVVRSVSDLHWSLHLSPSSSVTPITDAPASSLALSYPIPHPPLKPSSFTLSHLTPDPSMASPTPAAQISFEVLVSLPYLLGVDILRALPSP